MDNEHKACPNVGTWSTCTVNLFHAAYDARTHPQSLDMFTFFKDSFMAWIFPLPIGIYDSFEVQRCGLCQIDQYFGVSHLSHCSHCPCIERKKTIFAASKNQSGHQINSNLTARGGGGMPLWLRPCILRQKLKLSIDIKNSIFWRVLTGGFQN